MSSTAKTYFESLQKNFDPSQAADTQRRGIEAWTAASQVVTESLQELSRRQVELAQSSIRGAIEASKEALNGGTPEAGIEKQAQLAKHLFEDGVENAREAIEALTKSGFEAFDVLNQYAAESADKAASKPAATRKKKAS